MLMDAYEDLLDRTVHHRTQGNLYQIARRGGLSYDWLRRFCTGEIKNPGVLSLDRLAKALEEFGGTHHPKD